MDKEKYWVLDPVDRCKASYRDDGYLHCQDCVFFGSCSLLVAAGYSFDSQDEYIDPTWEYCEFFVDILPF